MAASVAAVVGACSPTRQPPAQAHGSLWAIIINGGRRPEENYQSHLLHVRQAVRIVTHAGVPPERIAAFMSDGDDPSPDVAVRERTDIDEFWRLAGTRVESTLRPPIAFIDAKIDGLHARPATREALRQWLATAPIQPADTVLLYVTDHGSKNSKDTANNSISLWGKDESLSVTELRELLGSIDPGVRVVSVMSQCFSGSFASLDTEASSAPTMCGFFSSTAERPAYGCYAENRGRENVGHSFHFLGALAQTGNLVEAHNRTLVSDDTPDVPLRSSDVFLQAWLDRSAAKRGIKIEAVVDELLAEAWNDPVAWEPEIRLLDRIAHRFGYSSPRSLAQLDLQTNELPDIAAQLRRVADAWTSSLHDDNAAALARFLAQAPEWNQRVADGSSRNLDRDGLRQLGESLTRDLATFTKTSSPAAEARLQLLRTKSAAAEATHYRMEVRLAALLRLKTLLTTVAGRQFMAAHASTDERARYERLIHCEDVALRPMDGEETVRQSADFPAFEDDVKSAQDALPSYMGIQFRPLDPERRQALGFNEGASLVIAVYPDTPAHHAAIEVGDIIVGSADESFTQSNEVRIWTMLAPPGQATHLQVSHEGQTRQVEVTPAPYPLRWPELPGPPKLASRAPALRSVAFRGSMPARLDKGRPHLLFFWATWCTICKSALPELLAYQKERNTQVVAITDEPAEHLKQYFSSAHEPFPETVAIDQDRRDFGSYGVSGTPSFALIDSQGRLQSYTTGYTKDRGLGFPGWKWSPPPETN